MSRGNYRTLGFSIGAILLALAPLSAGAASLSLDPSTGTYGPGDTFIVNVRLDTDSSQCINAAHVLIDYPTATLRAVDFGRGNSIFSLWISDPKLDTDAGTIDFQGGVPGGYCGRIPGDPALSNILGSIVFSVVGTSRKSAAIHIDPVSLLYANDGLGTAVVPALQNAAITIAPSKVSASNPWIDEVSSDTVPPEAFAISLESTRDVFDGKYYIVFSTVDKESGLDHYEIFEHGAWERVTSPHVLADQSLKSPIKVNAIDKAGNKRLGTYTPGTPPPRQYSLDDLLISIGVLFILVVALVGSMYLHQRRKQSAVVDLRA